MTPFFAGKFEHVDCAVCHHSSCQNSYRLIAMYNDIQVKNEPITPLRMMVKKEDDTPTPTSTLSPRTVPLSPISVISTPDKRKQVNTINHDINAITSNGNLGLELEKLLPIPISPSPSDQTDIASESDPEHDCKSCKRHRMGLNWRRYDRVIKKVTREIGYRFELRRKSDLKTIHNFILVPVLHEVMKNATAFDGYDTHPRIEVAFKAMCRILGSYSHTHTHTHTHIQQTHIHMYTLIRIRHTHVQAHIIRTSRSQ